MAVEKFRDINFRPDSLAKIENMVEIIEEYQQQGLRMTARQLYYQLVSRDIIANTPKEYKKLTALLTDARYAGMVDWDAIEDRGREPDSPSEWSGLPSLVESALRAYRLPRWADQGCYAELWVEKQALAGVLSPLAREFHVTLMVNKGYSSASAMRESAERIKKAAITDSERIDELVKEVQDVFEDRGKDSPEGKAIARQIRNEARNLVKKPYIFYLGDHDPSGEDMVRDIGDRLKEFGVWLLEVKKVALTMVQVKKYNPPPNPAKITDPRAAEYIKKHGEHSWEVDALPPDVLSRLIRESFTAVIDDYKMRRVKKREEDDKSRLRTAVGSLES
jgi:hypothetical protein